MTKKMIEAAKKYRVPEVSTPEELECMGFKTIAFGTETICVGYYYAPHADSYYTAVYDFTGKDHTCEGECRLKFVSPTQFEDEGHAFAWAVKERV